MNATNRTEQILEPLSTYQTRRCAEFKLMKLRELPRGQQLDTPERVAEFYEQHVKASPLWFFEKETFTVIFLSTRRRCTGFHIASIGTLDTLLVHPLRDSPMSRQFFR